VYIGRTVLGPADLLAAAAVPAYAQAGAATRNAASAYGGGIAGPASNPPGYLNGESYRSFFWFAHHWIPNFSTAGLLDQHLPDWIGFGPEERFRYQGYRKGPVYNYPNFAMNFKDDGKDKRP
jgi:hypothetical protein